MNLDASTVGEVHVEREGVRTFSFKYSIYHAICFFFAYSVEPRSEVQNSQPQYHSILNLLHCFDVFLDLAAYNFSGGYCDKQPLDSPSIAITE